MNESICFRGMRGCRWLVVHFGSAAFGRARRTLASDAIRIWTEGPAQACGNNCRTWVSASGAITSDTPRDFEAFAKTRNVRRRRRFALDSDGGSVLGALALGRTIRKLGMITTVGKTIDLPPRTASKRAQARAAGLLRIDVRLRAARRRRAPRAGGGARDGPPDLARRPPRRSDRGATIRPRISCVVQRDIGRLAQYTVEMGGGDRPARDRAEDSAVGADAACCRARNCAA